MRQKTMTDTFPVQVNGDKRKTHLCRRNADRGAYRVRPLGLPADDSSLYVPVSPSTGIIDDWQVP